MLVFVNIGLQLDDKTSVKSRDLLLCILIS